MRKSPTPYLTFLCVLLFALLQLFSFTRLQAQEIPASSQAPDKSLMPAPAEARKPRSLYMRNPNMTRVRSGDEPNIASQLAPIPGAPAAIFMVTNTNDSGGGSLRQAITDANTNPGTDMITFQIAPGGPQTITLLSVLPTITQPVTLDATTQSGFSGQPIIFLNGNNAVSNGFFVTAGATTIKGFAIINFTSHGIILQVNGGNQITTNYIGTNGSADFGNAGDGINIISGNSNTIGGTSIIARNVISGNNSDGIEIGSGSAGNQIQGNTIGLNALGNAAIANTQNGVNVSNSASNTIGGTAAGAGNVISGNGTNGISINGSGATPTGNQIQGNLIGTDATGTIDLGNTSNGVALSGTPSCTIGGTTAAARNVISGNNASGVSVFGGATTTGNIIQGNFIGTQVDGTSGLGNSLNGVAFQTSANNSSIGGTASGAGNTIAFNGNDGVFVLFCTGIAIRNNSIFSNGTTNTHLGIDLFPADGVTANDAGDGDGGSNNLQNFPVLTSATSGGGLTNIQGTLNSSASATFALDFFANPGCDIAGNGEGQTYLGSTNVTTDPSGNATINATFAVNVMAGYAITATATNATGNSSEFSACVPTTSVTLTVNSTGDGADSNTGDGLCDDGSGNCTLRAALQQANATVGTATIAFAIASGPQTINPLTPLPTITDPVIIDGKTQPGFSGQPIIELNGTNAGAGANGLVVNAGNSTIKGLVINRFSASGIVLQTNGSNTIQCNYIGTDLTGTSASGNGNDGISVSSNNNLIGGTAAGEGNLISGNVNVNTDGIFISGSSNTVQGNFIGTDVTGTGDLGNRMNGIAMSGGGNNTIGGTAVGARNVISGNDNVGVAIGSTATSGNIVQGNLIGTAVDGVTPLGNNDRGIALFNAANSTIGGTAAGAGNTIAFNGGFGIMVANDTGNAIRGNSIHANGSIGINLGSFFDGVTPNDTGDGDGGPNNLQNFPVLIAAVTNGTSTTISGTLNSTASTTFTLDFFANPSCDSSGNGEGQTYLGSTNVTTDPSGNASFIATFAIATPVSHFITSTATDPANNTSEFSQCKQVVSGFVVNVTSDGADSDTGDNACNDGTGNCTLRAALQQANATAGTQTIAFSVGAGGVQTFTPATALPTITDPVVIDGTTQPGFSGSPLIELNGSSFGFGVPGLSITAGNSTVKGLVINRFADGGISISTNGGNTVQGNYIGTNVAGTGEHPGLFISGIVINGVANNLIGGTAAGTGNVISGADFGILLSGSGATGNQIQGNLIGTNAAGTAAVPNSQHGIALQTMANNNLIGGTATGARNVISGNGVFGISIFGSGVTNNTIQGNYIGTNAAGTAAIGNSNDGISIGDTSGNTVGGATAAARNIISGNGGNGIEILRQSVATTNNIVHGNYIGTNAAGTAAIPNSAEGIVISGGASNNQIGGVTTTPGLSPGNVISGNNIDGINLSGATATGNQIQGNLIGTDISGTIDLGNTARGIYISAGSATIGGTATGARNVISGNNGGGIQVASPATAILIQGNFVGINAAGTAALGNSGTGVFINNSPGNTIGGTVGGAGNIISGNGSYGIEIFGSTSTGNLVQGNFVGTDVTGTVDLGNTARGIQINDAPGNTIGGTATGARNLISGNNLDGIIIVSSIAQNNVIQGNYIGTDVTGTSDLGNTENGILVNTANNTIGGTTAAARNLISGNNRSGIELNGFFGMNNTVRGNYIGTDATGTGAIANTLDGVRVLAANNNIIGGTASGEANLIAFNSGDGVFVSSGTGNSIRGNSIYGNSGLGIDLGTNGVTANDAGDSDSGANNLQNFPVLTQVRQGSTVVQGSLHSTANTSFILDFYSSPTADPSNFGEAQTYLGAANVTTDGSGNASFNLSLTPNTPLAHVVTATATDPSGNTSEFAQVSVVLSPTAITLNHFTATRAQSASDSTTEILLEWATGFEVDNLGFNLYRETNGKRLKLNREIIAGSALFAGVGSPLTAGRRYVWRDRSADLSTATYWLEELALDGRTQFYAAKSLDSAVWRQQSKAELEGVRLAEFVQSPTLNALNENEPLMESSPVELKAQLAKPDADAVTAQTGIASQPAAKLAVKQEGWYRVTQNELVGAGFNPRANPRHLQLLVDGREIPILVDGENDGSFDGEDAIEFYGYGLDTPTTDKRIYWLVAGHQPGLRLNKTRGEGAPTAQTSFTHTVERRDRFIYFSGLRNGDAENFFGALISESPVEQVLTISQLASAAATSATLEVTLQGVTLMAHTVRVELNDHALGEILFADQTQGQSAFNVPLSVLQEDGNTVRLVALNGSNDLSLVASLRLSYPHRFVARDNGLKFTAPGREQITVAGFTTPTIRVFDVTNPMAPQELSGEIKPQAASKFASSTYSLAVTASAVGERILLAINQPRAVAEISLNEVSNWRESLGADFLILTEGAWQESFRALKERRRLQGMKVAVVAIEDIYDEFSYGHKAVAAIKDFLQLARTNWRIAPRYVLLAGDASYDPRDYLRLLEKDVLPTKFVETDVMETASDDWFADFNNDAIAELAVGRLPVRSQKEAEDAVAKIVAYEMGKTTNRAILVSDINDGFNFEQANAALKYWLSPPVRIEEIRRGELEAAEARRRLVEGLAPGATVVNYSGHGSVGLWRGNLLTTIEARELKNEAVGLMVMMTCLNGFFQDPQSESLSEALMRNREGGVITAWGSSGLTLPAEQAVMNQALYRELFAQHPSLTIGEAIRRAKQSVSDTDVRRTWIFFGDPTLKLK